MTRPVYLAATWLVCGIVAGVLAIAIHGGPVLALLLGMAFGFPTTMFAIEWMERGR